jgi:hypothetical protein
MVELYIDRAPAVLPQNFSFELTRENPFFSKNGARTLDISLSLLEPENAKIYRHLNRINNRAIIPLDRSALLIVDNEVLLAGTEIIIEISEEEVKLQLVSGESELNFLSSDKKINELDMGKYPDDAHAFVPFFSRNTESVKYNVPHAEDDPDLNAAFNNCPSIYERPRDQQPELFLSSFISSRPPCVPLYVIVNKIVEHFKYSVVSSVLQSTDFQYLYVLNGAFTAQYSKMLPDWTVSEFFGEIEKLFNVIILVDEYSKEVEIRFRKDHYSSAPILFIDEFMDAYSQKIDAENRADYSVANIGYDTGSADEYFKYQNMDPEIPAHCETVHFDSFNAIVSYFDTATDKDSLKNRIFVSDDSGTQYICYLGEKLEKEDYYPRKVNAFEPVRNNEDSPDIDIKFRIKPAAMKIIDLPVHAEGDDPRLDPLYFLRTQMPVIDTLPFNPSANIDIQSILEGETSIEKQEVSDIFICFYQGSRTIFEPDMEYAESYRKIDYPVPFVDFLYEYNILGERKISDGNLSLRLNDPNGLKALYDQSIAIDTTREYTFRFIAGKKPDAQSLFMFGNKKFECRELKFTVNSKGLDSLIEGVFYPVG